MAIICESFDSSDFRWAQVATQAARLESLDKFPFSVEGKRELVFALLTADTIDQAKQIIDNVMADINTHRCPTPPDLRRMIITEQSRGRSTADELIDEFKRENKPATCVTCHGFGIAESIDANNVASVASYCPCSIGRARSSRPDPYSPERVNAARAKLVARYADVPRPNAPRKPAKPLAPVTEVAATGTDDGYAGDF